MSLFSPLSPPTEPSGRRPLADRMRPRTLEEVAGQQHLLGVAKPLRVQIERDEIGSMIFWGPPGVGKTTIARIIAHMTRRQFVPFSAVTSGIREIKQVMVEADRAWGAGIRTILFVDEIHRFNRAQQDAFLPYVEKGAIALVGATTENPSFELNSALLSRARVYVLHPLAEDDVIELLRRALQDAERGLAGPEWPQVTIAENELRRIARYANGDARAAYNLLEAAVVGLGAGKAAIEIGAEALENVMQRRVPLYDKAGEEHFNLISALHKSLRNSDADAAIYWLARMLESGEDPLYIARRMVRFASEDIGLADPRALEQALAARDAVHFIGEPEGSLALAQVAVYMALAPKSNSLYRAWGEVLEDLRESPAAPVPLHLRNAPTALMKGLGYGREYQYAHDLESGVADMECLPDSLRGRRYYRPGREGLEKRLEERLQEIRQRRAAARPAADTPPSASPAPPAPDKE
jgi:putative ATPase